jgi:uncharacterized protein
MSIQPKTTPKKKRISRRATIKGIGAAGAMAFLGKGLIHMEQAAGQTIAPAPSKSTAGDAIFEKVSQTVFIDTHEHIVEEKERLSGARSQDDWTALLSGYFASDMLTAGMPKKDHDKFFSDKVDIADKWRLIEPYWPAIKNTGYGQAARISIKELYGIDEFSAKTFPVIQSAYEKLQQTGFYKYVLQDKAKIESCQVNNFIPPFVESQYPDLLMQDIGTLRMIMGPEHEELIKPTGIEVKELEDWLKVIDWWFNKYGTYAVAAKSLHAYYRNIDYQKVSAEEAAPIFKKVAGKQNVTPEECKQLEDHIFWYTVQKATSFNLPVKLHTGYYAGQDVMPLSRVAGNPAAATDICRLGPNDRFVFMHICYPYYEPLIALAKHYTNAYIDMCWAWIINPVAAKDFLKKYLVTAPANKILTFGGDYYLVEQVVGHAVIARRGIAMALTELVKDGLLTLPDAMALIDPIMHGNARQIFDLEKKKKALKSVKWT